MENSGAGAKGGGNKTAGGNTPFPMTRNSTTSRGKRARTNTTSGFTRANGIGKNDIQFRQKQTAREACPRAAVF
jgi:hypothetical protein